MTDQDQGLVVRLAELTLKVLMVLCILTMSVLVFTNVVLRYGFNTSLILTEEIARYAFVWLTFLGGILAFARNRHVRMDLFVKMLPKRPRVAVLLAGDVIVLVCCYLIVRGCYELASLNLINFLPVTGLSVAWLYAAGIPFGIAVAGLVLRQMVHRLTRDDEGQKA
ncbi:MAG: TRAP transporter small permease [Pseudotabrizicola sp.]|uniref:TRAP transporter small permease n=1 Tax=Pseudotabrizicola sp. TaxID=2939647 RepID=UPI0027220277|nr:TRAP transporter small permease [Pseudotabrizicola sp.]MDO9639101.1 TRAP transporter small permease [Pseudotabrizicola sp.]